ncbi:MAG: DUF480 domain-containing protein [Planctomycetes bacterium]|nr:DUF480 domain-containing protein [Planctomycetota bacterium]
MLDPITQRVLGVLVEKELTVPDSYPLTENSILAGANQKNNRDPEMGLGSADVRSALETLREGGWASRVESPGARVRKWRHHFESQLGVSDDERAVLVELLLRGPQAPGALKPRVARLGLDAEAHAIERILESLARRTPPLVERLPRAPRERDERWQHLMGPRASHDEPSTHAFEHHHGTPAAAPHEVGHAAPHDSELLERLAKLEREVREMSARIDRLEGSASE